MAAVDEELYDRWAADLGRGREASNRLEALLGRYREPPRHYHTATHLVRVLRALDELLAAVTVADPAAVRLAAWYHDAVYEPGGPPGHNEAASAELARRDLVELEQEPERIASVERLVRVTASHEPASRARDEMVLCDADLGVLASDPATYDAYAKGVRAEYGHVPEPAWREGRAAVLRALLGRPVLYHTELMRPREPVARANMAAELAALISG
jgi:predicted metal-dependent HD superfamily phosphohydrolase